MDAFVWDQQFVTGLGAVDAQHHHLVDIINRVGDLLLADGSTEAELDRIFTELADYARYHFAEEERLMAECQLDPRYIKAHTNRHGEFVEQMQRMWQSRAAMDAPAEVLHGFLSAWLAYHILGEDQAMARQMAHLRNGDAAPAGDSEQSASTTVSALLSALHKLYHILSMQNRDLSNANRLLEERVAKRTEELRQTNAALVAEKAELEAMFRKLEEARGQLLQSEKMAAVGQLAAGVAHEINNPVGFVASNFRTLGRYVEQFLTLIDALAAAEPEQAAKLFQAIDFDFLRADVQALLNESADGLTRVTKIVRDLKDFSHVDVAEWQDADINAGLESTLNVVWNELKYKAEVVRDYADLPPVRAISGQINQVFMNLLVNAAQAIEKHGSITVRTRREGDAVLIEISDTGTGISPEVQKHLFEPFFTTKPVGKGTGLGLSLSYDIVVERHGGRIDVDSTPGKGTTFRICLPIGGKAGSGTLQD